MAFSAPFLAQSLISTGLFLGGQVSVISTVKNSTFTNNTTGSGGGIFNIFGTVNIVNTIIVGNSGSSGCEDCFGVGITSLGHNLVGIGTGCPTTGTGDLSTADAELGSLQDNGGPTFTHALLSSSPAIDGGDNGAAPAVDQRGVSRPQGSASDIGAFEFVPPSPTPTPTPIPSLSQWGLIVMAVFMSTVFVWRLRKRRTITGG